MKKQLLILMLVAGCSSNGVNREDKDTILKEFYAQVKSIQQVELNSNVKTGVIVGAGAGVIDELDGDHEDMIAGGLAGALVGGIFTALFEGSDVAYKYTLFSQNEGDFSVVQSEKIDITSQCVKVIVSNKVTIISTNTVNCA